MNNQNINLIFKYKYMFFLRKKTSDEIIKEKLIKEFKKDFKVSMNILPSKSLIWRESKFISVFANYIFLKNKERIKNAHPDLTDLELLEETTNELRVKLEELNGNNDPFYKENLDKILFSNFFNIIDINNTIEKMIIDELNSENENRKSLVEKLEFLYTNLSWKIKKITKKHLQYLNELVNFKKYLTTSKPSFIYLKNDDWLDLIFIKEEDFYLSTLKDCSYFIEKKGNYFYILLSWDFFNIIRQKIDDYYSNRIVWLSDVSNPYLFSYLVNKLQKKHWGDLNLTYFNDGNTNNPDKVHCSVRINWCYKRMIVQGVKDFELDELMSNITSIWGSPQWIFSDTDIQVWKFSFRVCIINTGGLFILNLRPTESDYYKQEDIEKRGNVSISKYIVDEEKVSDDWHKIGLGGYVYFDTSKKSKHFNLDYSHPYSQNDKDVFFYKLLNATKWTFWINGKTGSGKSMSLKSLLIEFVDTNIENYNTKNILMVEQPKEWRDYNIKQIMIDDKNKKRYMDLMTGIKRVDLDLCVIWEIRTNTVFWIINEISNSLPVCSTFHVATIEKFMTQLKDYSDKNWLNINDVLWNVNLSVCQILLDVDKQDDFKKKFFYTINDLDIITDSFKKKISLNDEDMSDLEKNLINKFREMVKKGFEKGMTPISKYSKKEKTWFYEMLTSGMINSFLRDWKTSYWDIYKYVWLSNTILYKTIKSFLEGNTTIENIKNEDYPTYVLEQTLDYIIDKLENNKKL